MNAIIEHVYFCGKEKDLHRLVRTYAESGDLKRVNEEDGCIQFEFFFAAERNDRMVLMEHWRDAAALDAHHATPMMNSLLTLIKEYSLVIESEKFEI